jgi:hypothetical protein
MDEAARIRETERRFRELESERNRYDILVGQLERAVRSDPGQRRDLDAMREKARLAHNQLRKARQELERLSAGTSASTPLRLGPPRSPGIHGAVDHRSRDDERGEEAPSLLGVLPDGISDQDLDSVLPGAAERGASILRKVDAAGITLRGRRGQGGGPSPQSSRRATWKASPARSRSGAQPD